MKNQKNQNFEKIKKHCLRYHFTHMYPKPQSYEVQFQKYGVRQFFLPFWAIFYPLPPPPPILNTLTTQKTKILKKWKKLTQIWSAADTIFCHFRPFFALLPHYWPQKLKFGKKKYKKNTWRYYPFTHVHHKSRLYDV